MIAWTLAGQSQFTPNFGKFARIFADPPLDCIFWLDQAAYSMTVSSTVDPETVRTYVRKHSCLYFCHSKTWFFEWKWL